MFLDKMHINILDVDDGSVYIIQSFSENEHLIQIFGLGKKVFSPKPPFSKNTKQHYII